MIDLMYPQLFFYLFIPTVVLFGVLFSRSAQKESPFAQAVLERLLKGGGAGPLTRITLLFISIFFMILALLRPFIPLGREETELKRSDIFILLDISASMGASDVYPSRLGLAKEKIAQLLSKPGANNFAVVAYADDAFLVCPLTPSKQSVEYLVRSLEVVQGGGSSMLNGLKAIDENFKTKNKTVVVFSDGGDGDLRAEIAYAKSANMKIFAAGLGLERGTVLYDESGGVLRVGDKPVISRFNPQLKRLAQETSGAFLHASYGDDTLEFFKSINPPPKSVKSKELEAKRELFYIPLALAALFFALGVFSLPRGISKARGGGGAAVLLCVFAASGAVGDAQALSYDFKAMQEGNRLYEKNDFAGALKAYSGVKDPSQKQEARLRYNIGNAHYRLGAYEQAVKSYERALKLDPAMQNTKFNLDLARQMLQKQQQTAQEPRSKQDPKSGQDPSSAQDLSRAQDTSSAQEPRSAQGKQEQRSKQDQAQQGAQDLSAAQDPHGAKDPSGKQDPSKAQDLKGGQDPSAKDPRKVQDPSPAKDLARGQDLTDPNTKDPSPAADLSSAKDPSAKDPARQATQDLLKRLGESKNPLSPEVLRKGEKSEFNW
ncbi:MAG: VWA domain-containing protein [Helicobacteraceae bacterium]